MMSSQKPRHQVYLTMSDEVLMWAAVIGALPDVSLTYLIQEAYPLVDLQVLKKMIVRSPSQFEFDLKYGQKCRVYLFLRKNHTQRKLNFS